MENKIMVSIETKVAITLYSVLRKIGTTEESFYAGLKEDGSFSLSRALEVIVNHNHKEHDDVVNRFKAALIADKQLLVMISEVFGKNTWVRDLGRQYSHEFVVGRFLDLILVGVRAYIESPKAFTMALENEFFYYLSRNGYDRDEAGQIVDTVNEEVDSTSLETA